ncbi:MAG: metal-dependent hydrolase [Methylovulum miyakonense]|uniref:metal-dependent hydrolase n=1 Tax=Methylovulum miyakonense TaxID=645578 RepID=UPI003BB7B50A
MIIGHAPSGYIMASLLRGKFSARGISAQLSIVGVAGALAPDLDMLYFHLADHRQHHHHTYPSHFPIVWLSLLIASSAYLRLNKTSKTAALAFMFCLGGSLHIVLDSIVGDIWWFAPFLDRSFTLFTVPALYQPWWLNFILHWSFALELALWVWALFIYRGFKRN